MQRLPWDPDRPLDLERLALRVARATHAGPPLLRAFDEGWDNWVVAAPGGLIYRFAKRRGEENNLGREARLLRFLAGRLPLPVPRVAHAGRGWFAYRFLRGAALSDFAPRPALSRRVGRAVGGFLTCLHALEPRGLRIPVVPRRPEVLRTRALQALRRVRGSGLVPAAVRPRLDHVPPAFAGSPVLVHNDLLAGHVLVARGRPAGVIDWTDAGLGDPAADFAGLYHWGGPHALEAALAAYARPVDGGLAGRAIYAALCVGLFDLDYGLRARRPEYVVQGQRALRWATAAPDTDGATESGAR